MQSILELVLRLGLFYLFITLGFLTTQLTTRAKWINKSITVLLLNLLIPLLILNTILTFSSDLMSELPSIVMIAILIHIIGFVVIFLRFRMLDFPRKTEGALLLCATFNNALFLPVPLVLIFIGEDAIPVLALFSIVQMAFSVTVGLMIGSLYGSKHKDWKNSVKKALFFPPFIAALIGAFLLAVGFTFPPEVSTTISNVNAVTTYLALYVIGLSIGTIPSFTEILRSVEVVLTRQFILPAIIFIVLLFSGLSNIAQDVLMIQALMPSAVFIVVYATEFGLDSEAAATVITLGTIILLPIVPLIPLILG